MKFTCKKINLKKNQNENQKQTLIEEDIGRINEKIELVNKRISLLDDEFILLVEKAENDNNISSISTAKAMKHKSSEKNKELTDLENPLKVAREKCRKLV